MIGILAGMGPRSTAPFVDLVLDECQRQYGARHDVEFPRMMIYSLPVPFYPDRATDHPAMEAALVGGLRELEATGADVLGIACNTAHVYYPQLARSVARPLLNMVELALDALPRGASPVALVAARPTAESGVYQAGLRRRGFEPVELDWQGEVDALIGSTRDATDPGHFRRSWNELSERAQAAGARSLLLACLDLSAIRRELETELVVVDAAECLARGLVREWRAGLNAGR